MSRSFFLIVIVVLLIHLDARAQTTDPWKFEVAAEFTTLNRDDFRGTRPELGFGGRFTFNLNKNFALESAGYFFPRRCFDCASNGRITEVVGGLKAGKRFQTWGIFAKARPGVVSFSQGHFDIIQTGTPPSFPFEFQLKRTNNFATDLGGVLEFYPSKRIITRFDAGDTIIHFKRRPTHSIIFDPGSNTFTLVPFSTPARTTHNFQFNASVGFRF